MVVLVISKNEKAIEKALKEKGDKVISLKKDNPFLWEGVFSKPGKKTDSVVSILRLYLMKIDVDAVVLDVDALFAVKLLYSLSYCVEYGASPELEIDTKFYYPVKRKEKIEFLKFI